MAGRKSPCYILGEFLLDSDGHRLIRGGEEIPLRPKSYELLLYLVEHHGHLVSKEELFTAVWPDSYITEGTLRQTVWEIREALGDHEEQQRLIKTIPKVGYQFVGEVQKKHSEISIAQGRNLRVLIPLTAAIIAAAGILLTIFLWQWPESPQPGSKTPLVVVLPFENLSPNPDDEYFGEGVTEEISVILSRIENLRVLPFLKIMRSKDLNKDLKEIVEELEVTALVEGSARFAEGKVRIAARLVDAGTGEQLWAEIYEEELTKIFEIQSNVARSVATALKGRLSANEGTHLVKMPPERIESHELAMRGCYFLRMGDTDQAISCYQRAITTDPDYARPYALLAITYASQAAWMDQDGETGKIKSQAEEAVKKALELDDSIPLTHLPLTALAILRELWELQPDWTGAEQAFRKAIDLNPNYWRVQAEYSMLLSRMGRFEEGLKFAELADQLAPYKEETIVKLAYSQLHAEYPDRALETARKLMELYPERIGSFTMLAEVYRAMGSYDHAIAVLNEAGDKLEAADAANGYIGLLGHLYTLTGANAEAKDCLMRLGNLAEIDTPTDPAKACYWRMAGIHMSLGEQEEALNCLEKCGLWIVGGPFMGIAQDPLWDPLRANPRFQTLLQKTNLPESSIRKPTW